MAVAAETITQTSPYKVEQQEKYAESISDLRRLAALACDATVSLEMRERQRETVFDNFKFAVAEMAATDPDFRDILDVDPSKSYPIINGQVCAVNGEPMVELIARGEAESRALADEDESMQFQFVRDRGDRLNAERVDKLPIGWTRFVPSMDPKEALQDNPDQAKDLGYKEGMMYWQVYSHSSEDTLDTSSHSVDMSDLTIWRNLIKDSFGVRIPNDVPADEWSRYGFEVECSAEEAKKVVLAMRNEYYKRQGMNEKRHSVTEYVEQNNDTIEQIFNSYYPSLANAIDSAKNNETVSGLASHILQTNAAKKLKPEIRQQLMLVSGSAKFNDEMGRTMNSILRYVTVEELRKGLPAFINGSSSTKPEQLQIGEHNTNNISAPPEILHQQLAANLEIGVEAGRSYGGCAGQIELIAPGSDNAHGPQEAYGGKTCPEVKDGQKTKCPHCNKEVRAIVPDKKNIYCSNKKCKLAAPGLKG